MPNVRCGCSSTPIATGPTARWRNFSRRPNFPKPAVPNSSTAFIGLPKDSFRPKVTIWRSTTRIRRMKSLPPPARFLRFSPDRPMRTIHQVLHHRRDLAIPLAVHIQPFREEVSHRIIKKVAKENALFALATALPDIVPFLSLPWAIGEFASDTALLTANQFRMAFLLAAANDRDIGYREQKAEVVSIMMGAFGWRALARELAGKIPLGRRLDSQSRHRLRRHARSGAVARAPVPHRARLHARRTPLGL